MSKYEGRLELTWTNKYSCLLAHDDGSYEWLDPSDYRVAEVRLLHDVEVVGAVGGNRAADNILIHGDALHALTSLTKLREFAREYLGKVKLAYLDPPFNTGQAFEHYDDALEHSVWLTMMRDRLQQIKPLLSPKGSIWVHLDKDEVHYCRIVMDEVFGRSAFVSEVVWRSADSSNNDSKRFSIDHNTLLVYATSPEWRTNRLGRNEESDAHYRNPDNDPNGPWFPGNVSSPNPRENLRYFIDEAFGWDGRPIPPPSNGWRWQPSTMREKIDAGEVVLLQERGKGRLLRKTYLYEQQGLAPSSLWADIEVTGHNRQAKYELKKLFPDLPTSQLFKTPKPERLIERIITIASEPDDIVLDCFAGSATTAAVAHKSGRRWVTIEREEATVINYARPRLGKVVEGTDPGGVTAQTGWQGGGGFRVLEVAPSMFEVDEGLVFLAEGMTNGCLAEVTAAQLGFEYQADPPFAGHSGRTRLAVIDGVVNDSVIQLLDRALPDNEQVVICGTAVDPKARTVLRSLRPGSTLRKIPAALLGQYRTDRVQLARPTVAVTEAGV